MHRRPVLIISGIVFLGIGVIWATFNQPADRAVLAQTASASAAARPAKTLGGQMPAKDDTVVLFYPQDPDTLNPLTANDSVSEEFFKLSYEYLAQRRYDDPTKWEPLLAESWDFNRDKLEYTIHLRKGVKWHPIKLPNGKELPATEFTAADVKFTFDCLFNKYVEASHYRSYYEDSEAKDEAHQLRMKVSLVPGDKYTVKMRLVETVFSDGRLVAGKHFHHPKARVLGKRKRRTDFARCVVERIRQRIQQSLGQQIGLRHRSDDAH